MKSRKSLFLFISTFFVLFLFGNPIFHDKSTLFAQSITFDHTYGYADYSYGKSIVQQQDSTYFVLANTGSQQGNSRLLLIKLDKFGIPENFKEFKDYYLYNGQFLTQAKNGDLLITGEIKNIEGPYQPFAMRVDTLFNKKWFYTFPSNDWAFSKMMTELPEGDIVIVGETYDTDSTGVDALWIKLSADGLLQDSKKSNKMGNDGYTSISLWNDTLSLVAGFQKNELTFDSVPFFSFLSPEGTVIQHVHYGSLRNKAVANQAIKDSLNHVVTVGFTRMYDDSAYKDFFMLVFNTDGYLLANIYVDYELWKLADNEYSSVAVATNGDIIVGANAEGHTYVTPTILLHRYNKNDYSFCTSTVRAGTIYSKADYLSQVIATKDGGAILIGTSTSLGTHLANILICKVDSVFSPMTPVNHYLKIEEEKSQLNCNMYPNPTTDKITLKVANTTNETSTILLYNSQLQRLRQWSNNFMLQPQFELSLGDFPNGIYFLKIKNRKNSSTLKVVKVTYK